MITIVVPEEVGRGSESMVKKPYCTLGLLLHAINPEVGEDCINTGYDEVREWLIANTDLPLTKTPISGDWVQKTFESNDDCTYNQQRREYAIRRLSELPNVEVIS